MTFSLMIQVLLPMSEKCISRRVLPDFLSGRASLCAVQITEYGAELGDHP